MAAGGLPPDRPTGTLILDVPTAGRISLPTHYSLPPDPEITDSHVRISPPRRPTANRQAGIGRPPRCEWESESGEAEIRTVTGLELSGAFLERPGAQTQGLEIGPDMSRRDFLFVATEHDRPVELRLIRVVPDFVAAACAFVNQPQALKEPAKQRGLDLFQGTAPTTSRLPAGF
jgi:hypothetical protein